MLVQHCRIIDFPEISDDPGCLTFVEGERGAPFPIRRAFCLYRVPPGESRGRHAHRRMEKLLFCVCGSFDVVVNDGLEQVTFHLDRPFRGLYIPALIWNTERNFAPGSVCLVLASEYYDPADYLRNYSEYLRVVTAARANAANGELSAITGQSR